MRSESAEREKNQTHRRTADEAPTPLAIVTLKNSSRSRSKDGRPATTRPKKEGQGRPSAQSQGAKGRRQ